MSAGATAGGGRPYHMPAMAREVMELLRPAPGETAVDATLGGGGHAELILREIAPGGRLIGIDRDRDAIEEAKARLGWAGGAAVIVHGRMGEIASILAREGVAAADVIVADLGVSSFQLESGPRGFSFMRDAPLDMRMDQGAGRTAADLLKDSTPAELERIIRELGEERYARRIAAALAGREISTTGALADAVSAAVPGAARRQRIHPATRTFQALRIAVNDELGELGSFLRDAPALLAPGGRMAVLCYHSLEDRMVKRAFRALEAGGGYSLLGRRARRPSEGEVAANPRSRSAKLRAVERTG
jgi:16S rRNA (cytosine1402-N4)-methyltransferase